MYNRLKTQKMPKITNASFFFVLAFQADVSSAKSKILFSFYLFQAALISAEEIREHRNEVRLLIQAFLICVMIALTLVGFFAVPQIPHGPNNSYGVVANIIWLICCANNCFIYLLFNK